MAHARAARLFEERACARAQEPRSRSTNTARPSRRTSQLIRLFVALNCWRSGFWEVGAIGEQEIACAATALSRVVT